MKSSKFMFGVMVGVAASMYMSKKRKSMMSSFGQSNGSMGGAADKAKDKIMGMAMTGFGSTSANNAAGSTTQGSNQTTQKNGAPIQSKEENLKMMKDFIRSNPDVKHEVEHILKETHTTIPGL
ncbi:hypothetical protein PaeBR_10595 [Paenibacillus sp. BR2-3]|uniref:hypothetical protein n=1 Tax=Paenibacillus sp. BR2-3 TaxID=3048494 RepID=UPI003977B765